MDVVATVINQVASYLLLGGLLAGVGLVGALSVYHIREPKCRPTWYRHERACHYTRVFKK